MLVFLGSLIRHINLRTVFSSVLLLLLIVETGAYSELHSNSWPSLRRNSSTSSFSSPVLPCAPESEPLKATSPEEPPRPFCEKWNPDFSFNGYHCCGKVPIRTGKKKKSLNRCSPQRLQKSYCSEMTPEQIEYTDAAKSGKLGDLLVYISHQMGRAGDQAYCNVNNGFLAHGRRIIETPSNRLHIKSPERCLHFGTDSMVGMIEWLGRELAKEFPGEKNSGVQLSIGDVAAPRGGCLFGKSGRRGHASHTSGQDADIGFINPLAGSNDPGPQFIKTFDAPTNWWFLKKIFKNPFGCIRIIFLDSRLIKVLEHYTNSGVPSKHGKKGRNISKIPVKLTPKQRAELAAEWKIYHPFIRHAPGHKNHFHVRVGYGPGAPGCVPGAHPELETEEDVDSTDSSDIDDESSIVDQLTRSSSKALF